MKVLVTGGAGYIGSHICYALSQKGYTPVVIDHLQTGFEKNVRWGPFYKGNIDDESLLKNVIQQEKIQATFHFAASVSVSESQRFPEKYLTNNFTATTKLAQHLINHGVDKFVFASSCAVYGECGGSPIDPFTISTVHEDHSRTPLSTYGQSKKLCEDFLEKQQQLGHLHSVILRFFNVAGALPPLGDERRPPIHLIPRVLSIAAQTHPQSVLKIYGQTFNTPDGSSIRDYVHIQDVADASLKALEALFTQSPSPHPAVYNVGSGYGTSVLQILTKIEKMIGRTVPHEILTARAGEPSSVIADLEKIKRELSWTPQHSSLEHILRSAYDHLKNMPLL